ncbi:MAG TPA: transposase, partial [Candidatus Tectomicrobia bacterium]|nr:transposase [Candidatus Tectomicrobia bacterium]
LQAIGVDEWAWRRGHRYGTLLVNLVDHRVVDLLPDRSAATVAAWLAQHPTISVVCRDRSDLYADGIRRGAPQAVQVVDRFHFVRNLRQALQAFLVDRRPALQDAAVSRAMALMLTARPVPVAPMYLGRRGRRPHGRADRPAGSPFIRPCRRCERRGLPSPPWPGSSATAVQPCMPTSVETRRPASDGCSGGHPPGSRHPTSPV